MRDGPYIHPEYLLSVKCKEYTRRSNIHHGFDFRAKAQHCALPGADVFGYLPLFSIGAALESFFRSIRRRVPSLREVGIPGG